VFRMVVTSVRGSRRFVGELHPFDGPTPPKGRGIEFESVEQAKLYARRELTDVTSCHRVTVVDADGAIVASAVRSGRNGTGRRWLWGT